MRYRELVSKVQKELRILNTKKANSILKLAMELNRSLAKEQTQNVTNIFESFDPLSHQGNAT